MLMELLIAASCASGDYQEACSKALEAGSKQAGVYQNVGKAEDVARGEAEKSVESVAGKTPAVVVGAAAKGYKDKALTYTFKPANVLSIDRVTMQGGKNKGSLNLEWSF